MKRLAIGILAVALGLAGSAIEPAAASASKCSQVRPARTTVAKQNEVAVVWRRRLAGGRDNALYWACRRSAGKRVFVTHSCVVRDNCEWVTALTVSKYFVRYDTMSTYDCGVNYWTYKVSLLTGKRRNVDGYASGDEEC